MWMQQAPLLLSYIFLTGGMLLQPCICNIFLLKCYLNSVSIPELTNLSGLVAGREREGQENVCVRPPAHTHAQMGARMTVVLAPTHMHKRVAHTCMHSPAWVGGCTHSPAIPAARYWTVAHRLETPALSSLIIPCRLFLNFHLLSQSVPWILPPKLCT